MAAFALSRAYYIGHLGVRFEPGSLSEYMQFIDPTLLRKDLLRSLFYLRDQPPLFNLFLGVVLKAFPRSSTLAFHVAYLAMGLSGSLASFGLARRLGADPRLAALFASALFALPGTILYEHWLFYGYPVAVLLLASALGLVRVLESGSKRDALLGFGALSLLVLTRGTFHLAVYLATLAGVLVVRHRKLRPIALGALAPTLLSAAVYAKHAILFHGFVIGDFYRGMNLAMMQMMQVGRHDVERLQESGAISRSCPPWVHSHIDLNRLLEAGHRTAPRRGVPILDQVTKSTGATNWSSTAASIVGEECTTAATVLLAKYPDAYERATKMNHDRYLFPADDTWPFQRVGQHNNADRLREMNQWVDVELAERPGPGQPAKSVKRGLEAALVAPLWFLARNARLAISARKRRRVSLSSAAFVACFATATLVYSAEIVIRYSLGDHNRYRAEVMPLVWTLVFATGASIARAMLRSARRALRPQPHAAREHSAEEHSAEEDGAEKPAAKPPPLSSASE